MLNPQNFPEIPMRYLHTMVRVTDVDQSLDFYCNKLGMKEVRRVESEAGRFTLIFLAAEAEPFSKSGGLANVVFELPRELARMGEKTVANLATGQNPAATAAPWQRRSTVPAGRAGCLAHHGARSGCRDC